MRCKDPTELGTYIDAVLCQKCLKSCPKQPASPPFNDLPNTEGASEEESSPNSHVSTSTTKLPNNEKIAFMLPKNSLEFHGKWACNTCNEEVDGLTIYAVVKGLMYDVETLRGTNIMFEVIRNYKLNTH